MFSLIARVPLHRCELSHAQGDRRRRTAPYLVFNLPRYRGLLD
jgi:hypothetical protein